ncbi:MAG: U32 family peptidase [Gammaproteobacteria bacterium]|jgi:collagenase-like PrtC family protease|nr:U32 family peptidase [Gammaproteobacteria bacterium]MBP6051897.1 U32 family peptidase [Pseudomonadales bacterium]MBK6581883.1 U32 family peptidase [Gammaproteobacteria bacterium]MBK7520718.1 U32 family peptidase [Gammaproteobacteria bacterium]MBK7728369.1 U32 family peptidase [Gammaproteobacteria bacterium]
MKIVAPISHIRELGAVLEAGADEIYFGMVPTEWASQFGLSSISRRMFGNISDYRDMQQIIAITHRAGKQAMLVLNAQHYTQAQAESLMRLAERFSDAGGDAIIIADTALLLEISELRLDARLHLSSIAACRNAQAAKLFESIGANRIIFPRYMKLAEIEAMTRALPALEFEAFVLNDGCIYEEGVCHTIHLPQQYGGPICMDNYRYSHYRCDGNAIEPQEQALLLANEQDYVEWTWYKFSCGFSTSKQGYTFGPCGICAIHDFMRVGLSAIKIAGREAPLERKIKSIELVRSVRDRVAGGNTGKEIFDYATRVRARTDLCESGYMCYYPEVMEYADPESSIARQ